MKTALIHFADKNVLVNPAKVLILYGIHKFIKTVIKKFQINLYLYTYKILWCILFSHILYLNC